MFSRSSCGKRGFFLHSLCQPSLRFPSAPRGFGNLLFSVSVVTPYCAVMAKRHNCCKISIQEAKIPSKPPRTLRGAGQHCRHPLSPHEEATVRCAKARPGSNSSTGSQAPVRPKTSHVKLIPSDCDSYLRAASAVYLESCCSEIGGARVFEVYFGNSSAARSVTMIVI